MMRVNIAHMHVHSSLSFCCKGPWDQGRGWSCPLLRVTRSFQLSTSSSTSTPTVRVKCSFPTQRFSLSVYKALLFASIFRRQRQNYYEYFENSYFFVREFRGLLATFTNPRTNELIFYLIVASSKYATRRLKYKRLLLLCTAVLLIVVFLFLLGVSLVGRWHKQFSNFVVIRQLWIEHSIPHATLCEYM